MAIEIKDYGKVVYEFSVRGSCYRIWLHPYKRVMWESDLSPGGKPDFLSRVVACATSQAAERKLRKAYGIFMRSKCEDVLSVRDAMAGTKSSSNDGGGHD